MSAPLEVWMRGPVAGITPLLQPVAHTLLQVREEVTHYLAGFDDRKLSVSPAGLASVGFHVMHLTGFIDRLFTYARGEQLTEVQLAYLASEGNPTASTSALLAAFSAQIDRALEQLSVTDAATLQEVRGVGRRQIPSTVIGLLFHAAEHASRHCGQLLVTVKIV